MSWGRRPIFNGKISRPGWDRTAQAENWILDKMASHNGTMQKIFNQHHYRYAVR